MESFNLWCNDTKKIFLKNEFEWVLDLDLSEEILQEINFVYSRISKLLLFLDNPKEIDKFTFQKISKIMEDNIDRIEKCLDCLWRSEDQDKKFEQMYLYYFSLEMDYANFTLGKIKTSNADLTEQIQKMFDSLSYMINQVWSRAISNNSLSELNKQFMYIREKLLSDESQTYMTVLQYRKRYALYQQAMIYVKETYL